MENPLQLVTQTVITITPATQQELLAMYYAFDDAVMREILCKQLSKRLRNVCGTGSAMRRFSDPIRCAC